MSHGRSSIGVTDLSPVLFESPTILSQETTPLPRLLVIGAGPAGVSAAIRLRDLGHEVLLVDRARFPRDKVCGCCLNLAALAALAKIKCEVIVSSLVPATLNRWELRLGKRTVEAPLPGGIAVSRWAMDGTLVDEAIRRGVQVRQACEARVIDVQQDRVTVSLREDQLAWSAIDFDAVVFATGLNGGGVSRWLPFTQSPSGPIGVGTILPANSAVAPRTIQMICGQAGYVGLVQLEDGRVDLASAIRRTRADGMALNRISIAVRINALLRGVGVAELDQSQINGLRMTPPLTRSRTVGFGGLIAVGDAARYVEPFTGEGMAWAVESGIEAADCIAKRIERNDSQSETLADEWKRRYRRLTHRRQWICRFMSAGLQSETISNCVIPVIRVAPWMARWTIERLNRTTK